MPEPTKGEDRGYWPYDPENDAPATDQPVYAGYLTIHPDGQIDHWPTGQTDILAGSGGGGDGTISVSEDGASVADADTLDLTSALAATDNGDGSVTIAVEQDTVDDWVAALLTGATGSNLSFTYDDANGDLLLDSANGEGVPQLNDQGTLLSSQLPDLGIVETYTVADESERLSLAAEEGDIAIQQDVSETYIFTGGDPSVDSNWSAFATPPAPVDSVFGRTGDVTAQDGDYALAQVGNVDVTALLEGTEANKPGAGTAGRRYWATDSQILYRDDGSTWNAIAGTGSSSNPLPEQHVQSLNADEALAGSPDRKLVSETDQTITVGTDVNTVQDAFDPSRFPLYIQHDYVVELPDGDYSDEQVVIPPFIAETGKPSDTSQITISLSGNATTPANVQIGSVYATGAYGKRPFIIDGVQFEDSEPLGDNAPSFQIDAGHALVRDCNFNNASGNANRMMNSYGGTLIIKGTIDGGTDNYDTVVTNKNGGQFYDECQGSLTADVLANAFQNQAGIMAVDETSSVTADNELYSWSRCPIYVFDSANYNGFTAHGVGGLSSDNFSLEMNGMAIADPNDRGIIADPTTDSPAGAIVLFVDGTTYDIPYYAR